LNTIGHSQDFSDRSNIIEIDLNKTDDIVSSLPVIEWKVPEEEYIYSSSLEIAFEAVITSKDNLSRVDLNIFRSAKALNPVLTKNLNIGNRKKFHFSDTLALKKGQSWVELRAKTINRGVVKERRRIIIR